MKRAILENLERRKREQIFPCDYCDATGRVGGFVCSSCLGQTVLLTKLERDYLLEIAGFELSEMDDDSILSEQIIY